MENSEKCSPYVQDSQESPWDQEVQEDLESDSMSSGSKQYSTRKFHPQLPPHGQPYPLPQAWTQLTHGSWGAWGPSRSLGPVAAGLSEGVGQKRVPWGRKDDQQAGQSARGSVRQTVSTCLFCQASFNCCAPVGQFVGCGWGHCNLRQGGWWGKRRLHRTRLQGDLGSNCHSLAADIQQDSTSLNLDCHRSDGNNNESYH